MDTMSYEQKLEKGQGGYFRQKKLMQRCHIRTLFSGRNCKDVIMREKKITKMRLQK